MRQHLQMDEQLTAALLLGHGNSSRATRILWNPFAASAKDALEWHTPHNGKRLDIHQGATPGGNTSARSITLTSMIVRTVGSHGRLMKGCAGMDPISRSLDSATLLLDSRLHPLIAAIGHHSALKI